MKLYDFHTHTSGISRCSRLTSAQLARAIKDEGIDGMVLTNHYAAYHMTLPFGEWMLKYEEEYRKTAMEAEKMGLHCFFGIEVTIARQDFLIYGLSPSVLYESERPLFEYTLKELSDFVHERGGLLIHAHPFRNGGVAADPNLLDGYEVNCHPLYGDNNSAQVHALCQKEGKLITCGSDYHGDVYKAHCGVYLPDEVQSEEALGAYLKAGQPLLLEHEIDRERVKKGIL
ncbi:MAG: hypothetical protein IJ344_00695 [Clostridia bacterium]|nr:hypothetical protein [Clostridia bacterium]